MSEACSSGVFEGSGGKLIYDKESLVNVIVLPLIFVDVGTSPITPVNDLFFELASVV